MTVCFVYVTAGSGDEARRIAGAIVTERLAACANILDGMASIYRWRGAIAEDKEVVLIFKTREALVERLTARVKDLHSYDCPCVVNWRIDGGNSDFLGWIEAETAEA